jgi:hypothetical protein
VNTAMKFRLHIYLEIYWPGQQTFDFKNDYAKQFVT